MAIRLYVCKYIHLVDIGSNPPLVGRPRPKPLRNGGSQLRRIKFDTGDLECKSNTVILPCAFKEL